MSASYVVFGELLGNMVVRTSEGRCTNASSIFRAILWTLMIFSGEADVQRSGKSLENIDANMVFLEDLLKDDGVPFQTTNSTDSKRTTMRLQMYYAKPRPLECTKYVGTCAAIENRITDYLGAVDVKLSYGTTSARKESFDPVNFLERGLRLKYHARCWQIVQPLIFAVAVPKCVDSQKRLIPRRLCRDAHDICGEYVLNALPQAFEPLKTCEDDDIFTDYINCEKETDWFSLLQTNIPFTCPDPMTMTNDSRKISQEINPNGDCALHCKNPFYSSTQQRHLHVYIAVMVVLSFIFNGSAFILLAVRWRNLRKYPDTCLLYINICFIMAGIGWAIQFIPGMRDLITCAEDGTERSHEPRYGESYGACLVTFLLIYYFTFAAAIWFVSLTYCWYRSFRIFHSNEAKVRATGFLKSYSLRFHLAAWCTPLILCLIAIATSGIDGNHISGICFIGIEWAYVRGFLLVLPLLWVAVISGFFVIRGLIVLKRIKNIQENTLSPEDKRNICATMLHIGFIAILVCICILISIGIHVHYYINYNHFRMLRQEFINCHLKSMISGEFGERSCDHRSALDFETVELGAHLGLQFIAGILFSTWVWRRNNLSGWAVVAKRKITKIAAVVVQRHPSRNSSAEFGIGVDNTTFVSDNPTTQSQPDEMAMNIIAEFGSKKSLYDSAYDVADRSKSVSIVYVNPVISTSPDFAGGPEENRLENWQEKAREVRHELRKTSTAPKPLHRISTDSMQFLQSISLPDDTVVMMDPNALSAAKRQRRLGRVEHFKQARPDLPRSRSANNTLPLNGSVSDYGSGSQEGVNLTDDALSSQPQPSKGILKISHTDRPDELALRDSPDEGIQMDLFRPEIVSRASVTFVDNIGSEDYVELRKNSGSVINDGSSEV